MVYSSLDMVAWEILLTLVVLNTSKPADVKTTGSSGTHGEQIGVKKDFSDSVLMELGLKRRRLGRAL